MYLGVIYLERTGFRTGFRTRFIIKYSCIIISINVFIHQSTIIETRKKDYLMKNIRALIRIFYICTLPQVIIIGINILIF